MIFSDSHCRAFLPPANGVGDTPPLLCYLCVTFLIHFKYRAVWRILLFGYELVPGKEKLEEGTVVILVRAQSHQGIIEIK